MEYFLMDRESHHSFKVPYWFMLAFNYVNLSEHKWLFMQKEDIGKGRKQNGRYEHEYYYDSFIGFNFESFFFRYSEKPCRTQKIEYNPMLPTYCNVNCAMYAFTYGRNDIAKLFKANSANVAIKQITDYPRVKRLDKIPKKIDSLIIAAQLIPGGIGHVAPVISNTDKGYVANIGAFLRHGVVPIEYAFATDITNIQFIEVK